MRKARVGIVGIEGRYGQWLQRFFKNLKTSRLVEEVFGSDLNSALSNAKVVDLADVVIISVPPRVTVEVIDEIASNLRSEQLVMDVTSLKGAPVRAMLKSSAEVVGLHPMCAPPRNLSWRGQTVVYCPARLQRWQVWVDEMLRLSDARLKICTPAEHDHRVAVVQGLVHAMHFVMAATIRRTGISVEESLEYTSPLYRIAFSLMGRILHQSPDLYADIQMENPMVSELLEVAHEELGIFKGIVERHEGDAFAESFLASREHFGGDVIDKAFELFDNLNQLMTDRLSCHRVTLELRNDHPGVLYMIAGMFAEVGINLVSFHSSRSGRQVYLHFSLDRSPDSLEVQAVLDHIAGSGIAFVV